MNAQHGAAAMPGLTAGLLGLTLGVAVASPLIACGALLAVAARAHWRAERRARRVAERLSIELPSLVDEIIQRLKAGASLARALRTCLEVQAVASPDSPLCLHLQPLRSGLSGGLRLADALARPGPNRPPEVDLLLGSVGSVVRNGGPAVPSLERLNDTLRSAAAVDLEVKAHAGQALASSAMLAGLPCVFVVMLAVLDVRLAHFYLFEAGGAVCILTAGSLSYLSWWWMHRLVWAS